MKKNIKYIKKYFNSKKPFLFKTALLFIGIIIIGILAAFSFRRNKPTFKTISYDEEATSSGQVAGVYDNTNLASPSPTLRIINKIYISPTPTLRLASPTPRRTSDTTSNQTTNQTATPNSAQVIHTPTPIQNTPTPGPTSTPAATPTPSFNASINTNVDGDTLKVTVEANRPLKTCLIHFLKDVSGVDVPVSAQNPGISDNSCSADFNKSDVKKVRAYIASTDGQTAQPEKSGPFE
jgi:hypothetical protein